ncbi:T3SS effector HopA1 family protein [Nocardioides pantholopis]|uniref:T3SS effector HopA1 family protein n=1 Tax=Nocardioides pantholopis TaxID=2483798 RepID=UPI000F09958E|nr:T3SS effector HopA1 family protein [Nocardioides pantholopis]
MSTLTAPVPATDLRTPSAELMATLEAIEVDPSDWTATVGPRRVSAESAAELRMALIGSLYEVLHAGRAEEKDLGRIVRERDVEEVLLASLPHATSPRAGRILELGDGGAVVDLGDVRAFVPDEHLPDSVRAGAIPEGVTVLALPAARPALSHGFFLIDGPRGMGERSARTRLRRLYLHAVDPESAAGAWRVVLETLNAADVPYRSKALSHRDGYPRRDAIVVYLPVEAAAVTEDVAAAVADVPGIAADTSAFAHRIRPGLAVADEPRDPRPQYRELSFGEHRSAVAATALIRAAQEPDSTLADLFVEECRKAHVDPAAPAFNLVPDQ